jgi:hypothetical protein
MLARVCVIFVLLVALLVASLTGLAAPTPVAVPDFPANFPYRAFDVTDSLGRSVRFYLSDADVHDARPLILVIQGSGCASSFFRRDGRISQSWHALVRQAAAGRAQVLVVEKPGVQLFDLPQKPGGANDCTAGFKREHTRDRWLAALQAGLRGALEQRAQKPAAVMALGHSEGAAFAPYLAIADPAVTHVASLAASPLSQLHDFFDMAARGEGFIAQAPGNKADHIKRVLDAWKQVQSDPQSDSKSVFGHAHRYWNDKFAPFDWTQLDRSRARFFLAHGDADENSSVRVFDHFAIELIVRGRDVTWLRLAGADHGFGRKDVPGGSSAGMTAVVADAVAWMLGEPIVSREVVWPQ